MNLRLKLVLYLTLVHILVIGAGIYLLWDNFRPWILLLEALVIVSFIVGIQIIKGFGIHLDIISSGADFIREKDFSHTFTEVDSRDINKLIEIYNNMITHLREEKILLEEQQLFLQKVFNASPSGIISLDFDNKVRMFNRAILNYFDLESKDIEGKQLADLNCGLSEKLLLLPVGETNVFTIGNRRKLRCSHLQYRERGFLCSFFLLEEITHELWKSEKTAYETLIRTFSHEVNNTVGATNSILRSSLTYGKQLAPEDKNDFEHALNVAIERTDQLNKFMTSYADVIRLPEPVKKPANPLTILERIEALLTPEMENKNIQMRIFAEKPDWSVPLDVVQMEQALMNIVRNSIEAIDKDGTINIYQVKNGHQKSLIIEDSGSGLSSETSSTIFTPFFSTKENGQGIGLTLTGEILSKHGMDFSLETGEDGLTRFTIHLQTR